MFARETRHKRRQRAEDLKKRSLVCRTERPKEHYTLPVIFARRTCVSALVALIFLEVRSLLWLHRHIERTRDKKAAARVLDFVKIFLCNEAIVRELYVFLVENDEVFILRCV